MLRDDLAHRALQLGKVVFIYLPIMRSDGETFSLNERTRNAREFFPKLFFRCIQRWQELRRFLPPQSARSCDIKSVAASVSNRLDSNTIANVIEIAAT